MQSSPTFVEHVRRLLSPGPPSEPRRKFRPTPAIDIPKTRYAKSSGLSIAYQVIGHGPQDLVYVPGWLSNVEMMWENPALASFLHRLASFTRLIVFDKRGTGLSDRVTELPTLEQRMDDVRAVMDAVGSRRAALFGHSEGGCMCILFAATYPGRAPSRSSHMAPSRNESDPRTIRGHPRWKNGFVARTSSSGTGVSQKSPTSPTTRRV